jgi:VanZ family protein
MIDRYRRFAFYVLPLLLWMALIFSLSTNSASAEATNPVVNEILRKIFPGVINYLSEEHIHTIDFCIRKGAHITEYTLLTLFAFRAFRYGRPRFQSFMAFGPPLFCVLYAASDEFHQSFYSQRGAAIGDVFIDSYGVLLGTFIALWTMCCRLERSRVEEQNEESLRSS